MVTLELPAHVFSTPGLLQSKFIFYPHRSGCFSISSADAFSYPWNSAGLRGFIHLGTAKAELKEQGWAGFVQCLLAHCSGVRCKPRSESWAGSTAGASRRNYGLLPHKDTEGRVYLEKSGSEHGWSLIRSNLCSQGCARQEMRGGSSQSQQVPLLKSAHVIIRRIRESETGLGWKEP